MNIVLATTTSEGWQPGIGDPTVVGWLTVAAYFATAALCWRASRAAGLVEHRIVRKAHRLWFALAILFIALGINKQLDIQSLFTDIGRRLSRREGWYDDRRGVQYAFIAGIAVTGATGMGWLVWIMRDGWKLYGTALIGTIFIITFIIVRAASFHHVDELLGSAILGMQTNWILELGGIACVSVCAWRNRTPPRLRKKRSRPPIDQPIKHDPDVVEGFVPMNQRESFEWMAQRVRGQ